MLDVILAMVLLLSGLIAYLRGFIHEVLSIVAWVGAAFAAMHGLPLVRPFARDIIRITWAADAAAAVGIFLVVLLVLSIGTRAVARMVQSTSLGALDRSLGFVFGLARGAILITLAYILVVSLVDPMDRPEWLTQAKSRPLMEQGAEVIRGLVPGELMAARSTIDGAAAMTRDAMERERAFHQLTQPLPKASPQGQDDSGYKDSQRREMDKLFQSNQ